MRKLHLLSLLLVLPSAWFVFPRVQAQEADAAGRIYFVRERKFRIPFQPVQMAQWVKQLQLYVSTDQGRRWEPFATAAPEQQGFSFTSQADGLYWFSVQTQGTDGRLFPPSMEGTHPSLKVMVDTTPPTVILRPLPPRAGEVGVSWEVRDDHLDLTAPDALILEYRAVGSSGWNPLLRRGAAAQLYWAPQTNAVLEVRLRARDRAGNWGEDTTNVGSNADAAGPGHGAPAAPVGAHGQFGGGVPVDPSRKLINSKTVTLNFEIREKGPSGISLVELWVTQDGRGWQKYPLPPDQQRAEKGLTFPVNDEGVYGFTILAKSGVGLGERPPQLGDRPQIWVEVDLTRPQVNLQQVIVGQGADKGKLTVLWTAADKNLDRTPIAITFAEQAAGPWRPLTNEKIANSGRYVWTMPPAVPYQFYVKVEASDTAGNVGEAVTTEMVKVDLAQPKVQIIDVQPGR